MSPAADPLPVIPPSDRRTRPQPLPAATVSAGLGTAVAAAMVTLALLVPVQLLVRPPMLLGERFLPGAGWMQVVALAVYAGWLAVTVQRPGAWARWRPRVWALFSVVFFGQLILGLLGVERCLMSGTLHLPVPMVIVAGPVWRGEGLFMVGLLLATLVLVGPAWCSWLCYIGAWDQVAAGRRRMRRPLSTRARESLRLGLLALSVGVAWGLRAAGAGPMTATWLAAGFGLAGVGVMALVSARVGWLAHCTSFCPVGWLVVRLGKVSPFRLRIDPACRSCGHCRPSCRYGALDRQAWTRLKPGISCTMCGDCVDGCGALSIGFARLHPDAARRLLGIMVTSLHAVFLGLARL